ncbi:MAG: phosphate/phosphite/phosphonate ABC transporter substrate-binding protein [Magnetococcales bacterium]|nr:phosphate/phosphite/phosphonate ABC transporter substrate-binding protein [Magnetococcales bacterium]
MRILPALGGLLVALISLVACSQKEEEKPLQYRDTLLDNRAAVNRLVPHPLYNPQKLSEVFQPLVDHLNRRMPEAHIVLEASRDYQAYEQKFRAREAEWIMPNPWQTVEAMRVGYHVIAMWGDAEDFKGIFIVRKDGGVQTPDDLKGKVVSYPSPTALAAAIMPQYFLHTHGINVNKDIQNNYVGSQESSIMNVYLGQSAAGATWPPPWRMFQKSHPDEAAQLQMIWETPSLVNNSVMVRDDVPEIVWQGFRQALLDLPKTPEGQKILAGMETSRFHPANDATYDVVRQYVARFEQEVRKVESK